MNKSIDQRAREIVEAEGIGFVKAKIRAAREAFGIPPSDRAPSKADLKAVAIDGSVAMFAELMEIGSDSRASLDTRAQTADIYLKHAAKILEAGDEGGPAFIDPDADL